MSRLSVAGLVVAAEMVTDYMAEEICGPARIAGVVRVRQAICWIARNHTSASYPMIAAAIGRKDHTTIIYAVQQCQERMRRDEKYAALVEEIRSMAMNMGRSWMVKKIAKLPVHIVADEKPLPVVPTAEELAKQAEIAFRMREREKIIKRTGLKPDGAPIPYPYKACLNEDKMPHVEAVWRLGCAIIRARVAA